MKKIFSKMTSVLLALLMVCALLSATAFAADGAVIYVDGAYTGTDSDGTEVKPFTSISAAVNAAVGGETIKIYAFDGEYDVFRFANKQNITFEGVAVNGKKPVIACGQEKLSYMVSGVTGSQDVTNTTFKNIEFKNYGHNESWVDASLGCDYNTGTNWDGLVVDSCDFTVAEDAKNVPNFAIAPHCGDFTMTGCTITGYNSAICMMCDSGALTNVSIKDNTIKVKNEIVSAYWGSESADDVTSTVEITGNTITGLDGKVTPMFNITDYAYQQGKDKDAVEKIIISNNKGEAQVVAVNMNKTDVAVQDDYETIKNFSTEELAKKSDFVQAGEGFYLGYDASKTDNQIYELSGDGSVVKHEKCTSTELKNYKAATCTEDGYSGDKVCTVCGKTVEAGKVLKATGHTYKDGVCVTCKTKEPAPATGDASTVAGYMVLCVAALAVVVVLKKRNTFAK